MLKNYLKIAWRNLSQNKVYSALTILGLSLGLAACMLSVLYVKDELGYDKFNINIDRIYRVNGVLTAAGKSTEIAVAPTPMGQTMKQEFPEIEAVTRLGKYGSQLVKSTKAVIREQRILYADSTVFDVFTLPMVAGNPKRALAEPQSVVISERMARKYFGEADALNQTLTFNNSDVRKVTGVIRDIPSQSHFEADFLLPLHETKDAKADKWGNHIFNTYVLLRPGSEPASVEAKFEKMIQTYLDPALQRYFQTTLAKTRQAGNDFSYSLMPLEQIHLYSNREGELKPNSSVSAIALFALIGFFILAIAVFNFINLTTARSAKRSREIGVRKVLGSDRSVLVAQFLSESLLTTLLALIVGIVLLLLLLPEFNTLAGKQLSIANVLNISGALYLLSATVLVGVLAGIYPAFFLSSFKPISALKGVSSTGNKSQTLRTTLVVSQFSISILLIIGSLIVNQQLRYIQTQRVGFANDQVLIIKTGLADKSAIEVFKDETLRNPNVKSGAVSGFLPVASDRWNDMWFAENETDDRNSINMQEWMIDPGYISTFGLQLVQGRNFVEGSVADQESVIINQSAAKRLGYKNPVGKTMHKAGGELLTIIGVVQDFHYESLRDKIQPLAMVMNGGMLSPNLETIFSQAVSYKIGSTDISSTIKSIEATWKKLQPAVAFEYSFLNEDFDAMYRAEQRIEKVFASFAFVAIFIACLGLFGLSAFAAEKRTKEIGVRKVLGASVSSVVTLLSRDFVKPVFVAVLIATPLGWFLMEKWLEGFAYKIEIQWWVFVLAGIIAFFIALVTVSFQSFKTALMNPVKSLKSE
jgi:putative ABC transport system permease protein